MKKQEPCTLKEVIGGRCVKTTEDVANICLEIAAFLLNLRPCETDKKRLKGG